MDKGFFIFGSRECIAYVNKSCPVGFRIQSHVLGLIPEMFELFRQGQRLTKESTLSFDSFRYPPEGKFHLIRSFLIK